MKAEDFYHTGIVVDDLDATLEWFKQVAGYRWTQIVDVEQVIETPHGETTVPLRMVYSTTEPRLEFLQTIPGTVWVPASSGVHHLGYWSDDVDGDIATLQASGLDVEVRGVIPNVSTMWAYCKCAGGPRIELVSRAMQPFMADWFAGTTNTEG